MQSLTPERRRAMFRKLRDPARRFAFPLRGKGGTARRNRRILYTAGTAAVGGAILLGTRHGSKAALNLVSAEAGKVVNRGAHGGGYSWVYDRPAFEAGEKFASKLPYVGRRLYGAHTFRGKGAQGAVYEHTMLHGVPLIGKVEARTKRFLKRAAAATLEKISLWNVLGKEDTVGLVRDAGELTKMKVAKGLGNVRNFLVRPPRERPRGKLMHAVLPAWTRRPQPQLSRVERFVSVPFNKVSRGLKRADVMSRRRIRQFIRRQRTT